MKRYLLFCGSDYYPSGGWDDFVGDFDSINESRKAFAAEKKKASYGCDWWHVVDTETKATITQWPKREQA